MKEKEPHCFNNIFERGFIIGKSTISLKQVSLRIKGKWFHYWEMHVILSHVLIS